VLFGHRHPLRGAVHLGTRDVDEFRHTGRAAGFEQSQCTGGVDVVIVERRMDRMPDAETGEVIHDLRVPKDWRVGADVADVVFEQRDTTINIGEIFTLAVDQAVDHDNGCAVGRELPDQLGPDEARASGDNRARTAHAECPVGAGSRMSI